MELLWKDIRHVGRGLVRNPSFSVVATLSLALGIGANSAVFSIVDGALLRPMPVGDPSRLVAVFASHNDDASSPRNFSYPNFRDLQELRSFSSVVGSQGAPVSLTVNGEPELAWSEMVTPGYFDGLRVPMNEGRPFHGEEASNPATANVAVLSYDFWQARFGANSTVIGRTLRLNGRDFTIVGVAGTGFTGVKFLGFTPDLWVPLAMHEVVSKGSEGLLERRGAGFLNVRARLADGVRIDDARAELDVFAARLRQSHPEINRGLGVHLVPSPRKTEPFLEASIPGLLPLASSVLFAVFGIVLLVACANVASLQLARGIGRSREVALRLSLGATRARVLRHTFLESLILASTASALGLVFAAALLRAFDRMRPVLDFDVQFGYQLDARVFLFTLITSAGAGLVTGLLPAIRAWRREASEALKQSSGSREAPLDTAGRRWLVVPQLALSVVALVSASLLVASFRNVSRVDPGFSPRGIRLSSVDVGLHGYDEERGRAFYRDLIARLAARPDVDSVSLAGPLPLDTYTRGTTVYPVELDSILEDEAPSVLYSVVGDGYFETMGTPIVHGREFTQEDAMDSQLVVVVNEAFANRFWPGDNAIGKGVRFRTDGDIHTVVGVARTGKYLTLGEAERNYLFFPLAQSYTSPMTVVVRSNATDGAATNVIRDEARGLDPTLPVYGAKTLDMFLERSLAGPRALASAVTFSGFLAAAIAAIGVYGVMSFSVARRRYELGIRMALGASAVDVRRLFVHQTLILVGTGLLIGLIAAWVAARAMSGLLFGVSSASAEAYAVAVALLAASAIGSGWFAARRATRLDPVTTLRAE